MARKARRASQSPKLPASLKHVHLNAAGIDVGSESHYVAVPVDRDERPVRTFSAFTPDLLRLADWLKECKVDTVAMESTGVYWIPLYEVLRQARLQGFPGLSAASEACSRPQERCAGLPVAAGTTHLRSPLWGLSPGRHRGGAARLHAPAGYAGVLRLSAHPAHA